MVKVEFFGIFRVKLKTDEIFVNARNLKELVLEISRRFPEADYKELNNAVFFINDCAKDSLFKSRIKLNDGDRVLMLSPSGGG